MEIAIQQQRNLAITGGSSAVISPSSPLPKRPGSGNLLDIHINTYSDASLSPVHSGSSQATQRPPGDFPTLPEIVYSNPIDAVGLDKCTNTQLVRSQATVKSCSPGRCCEPVYSDPVDVIQPTCNPQKYSSANFSAETVNYDSQSEPVYSEISHFTPYKAEKQGSGLQNKEQPIYSLPQNCAVFKTQENAPSNPAKDSKPKMISNITEEVIYSQINKLKKTTKPQDKYTIYKAQEFMSEDLGLI